MKLPKGTDKFEVRVTQFTVSEKNKPIFDESAISVSIDDEAGGEFVRIRSNLDSDGRGIASLDVLQWPALRSAIDYMVKQCREY